MIQALTTPAYAMTRDARWLDGKGDAPLRAMLDGAFLPQAAGDARRTITSAMPGYRELHI